MRDGIVVAAPCKINTHLRVLDRRADGFHEIESVFQALSFGDLLSVDSLKERSAGEILMDGPVPQERNIVHKALSSFRRATGFDGGVRIRIEKRIPFGAGLGGGSADAAAALIAFSEISGMRLPSETLSCMAAELGSDVPFFLRGGTAIVGGRGERVEPAAANLGYTALLAHPGFSSDTAVAYRLLDEDRAAGAAAPGPRVDPDTIRAALVASPADWPFYNDFLPILERSDDRYGMLLRDIRSAGACFSGLSGSGSVCFGVFLDPKEAAEAETLLKKRWSFVRTAVPLARGGKAVLE